MQTCWATEAAARPTFDAVVFSLGMAPAAPATAAPEPATSPRPAPRGAFATADGASTGSACAAQLYE